MNLEDKVTNLEWSQKLKACGFPQGDAHFISILNKGKELKQPRWELWEHTYLAEGEEYVARPLPCEIMDRLPNELHGYMLQITKFENSKKPWGVGYYGFSGCCKAEKIKDTLANSLAAMYCYLDEKKLLKQGG